MLNGELLGHVFEIHRRAAFARDFAASGGILRASPLIHPLTLAFSDGALERQFLAQCFEEDYGYFVMFGVSLCGFWVLFGFVNPSQWALCFGATSVMLCLLGARARLHRMPDQHRALSIFGRDEFRTCVNLPLALCT